MMPRSPSVSFPSEGLQFLRSLARHNDRDWFKARKSEYEASVLAPLKGLLMALSDEFAVNKIPLRADPAKSVFRVYRDVRFSADKRPYKTHASGILSPLADKSTQGVIYLHLEPGASFVASAFYEPDKDELHRWRVSFVEQAEAFQVVLKKLRYAGLELKLDEGLKQMPRDFREFVDAPLAPYFKLKSFLLSRPLKDTEVTSPELVRIVRDFAIRSLPLLEYGWELG